MRQKSGYRFKLKQNQKYGLFVLGLFISACTTTQDSAPNNYGKKHHQIANAIPVSTRPSKYGNPSSYRVLGKTYYVLKSATGFTQSGIASWYGKKFHGRKTSSGEKYDMYKMTAAHKTLPIPVYVEVTNKDNGRKAVVRVNDRGPFHAGRIIDLSYAAATKLGVAATGTANVAIRVINSQSPDVATNKQNQFSLKTKDKTKSNKIYVQVAAFSAENNALNYRERLLDQGFPDVRLALEKQPNNMIYRVQIGPLPSRHVAQQIQQELTQKNYHNTKIIQ